MADSVSSEVRVSPKARSRIGDNNPNPPPPTPQQSLGLFMVTKTHWFRLRTTGVIAVCVINEVTGDK